MLAKKLTPPPPHEDSDRGGEFSLRCIRIRNKAFVSGYERENKIKLNFNTVFSSCHIPYVSSSARVRHRFDADPDPNFHFDADPDPDPDPERHPNDADPAFGSYHNFYKY
jgi:hypothetical protein